MISHMLKTVGTTPRWTTLTVSPMPADFRLSPPGFLPCLVLKVPVMRLLVRLHLMYQVWHNGGRGVHGEEVITIFASPAIDIPHDLRMYTKLSVSLFHLQALFIQTMTHRVLVSITMHITWLQYIEHLLYLGLTFGFGRIRLNYILNYKTNKENGIYWALSNLTETENYNSQLQMIQLRFRKFK